MNPRERIQRELDTRIEQLRTINDQATSESRELTPAEEDQVTLLRSEIADYNLQLTRPTQPAPERREPATLPGYQFGTGETLQRASDDPSTSIRRVAEEIAEAVSNGESIRRAVTLPAGWVQGPSVGGDPLDVTDLASFFTTIGVTGTTAAAIRFDATDGQVVAEGAPKPDIVTATLVPAPVQKVAGMAIITTEGLTFVDNAQSTITNVLRGAIIAGQNAEIMQVIEAGGTAQAFVTDALTTVLTASAMVNTKAQASVVITNPADYVSIALELAKLPQSLSIPQVVVSEDATAGVVTVAARSGVQVARTQVGLLADPYTLAHENKTRIVAEMFVAASVVRPNVVYNADVTAAA